MADWGALQRNIGVSFNLVALLEQALVHRSYLNENPDFPLSSNERLEFLGDALLGLVVAEKLYMYSPALSEGEMTRLRSALVCQDSLASLASSLQLGDYLYLGKGEEKSGGRQRQSNLACTLEALIGAIFVDQGFVVARNSIQKLLEKEFQKVTYEGIIPDGKSTLQELAQAKLQVTPVYRTIEATGPDHDKEFTVEVTVGGTAVGRGRGKSKHLAEEAAAHHALQKLSAAR